MDNKSNYEYLLSNLSTLKGVGIKTSNILKKKNINSIFDLEELLNIDDTNLYNYYNGLNCDIEFKKNNITSLFKDFKYID